ncbi:MAG: hypothetical protein WCS12_00960 [Acholeplasmataceae bacterium]|nr:hypothetical protein [Acholeplasmataceae bacterium]MCK9427691.1 hypothetical protein [Acholeplasmataceae bacterium]
MKIFKKKPIIYNLNAEELEKNAIIISNHSAASGPLTISLYFPLFFTPWGTYEMTERYRKRWQYLYHIFYRQKLGYNKFKSFLLATLFGIISKALYKGMQLIPTYTDLRLKNTLKISKSYLDKKSAILIFPEDSNSGYHEVLLKYNPGFVHLSAYYYKRTKVDLPIYPIYFHKKSNSLIIGEKEYLQPLFKKGLDKYQIADHFKTITNDLSVQLFNKNRMQTVK